MSWGRGVRVAVGAAVALALAAPGGASAQQAEVDLAAHPSSLEDVPMQYRPKFRWWWPTANVDAAEVARELEAMKAAGFGGVEQTLLRSPNEWWAPAFRQNVKAALEKATELGMRFDTTLGPMWPISSPAVDDFSKRLSMQEGVISAIDLVGPSTYSGPVPDVDDNGARAHELVAATAAQPVDAGATLDPRTAIDLSPKVSGTTLTWDVPAGHWKLFGIWSRATGQRAHGDAITLGASVAVPAIPTDLPDVGGQTGPLVPDHFSRAAIDATLGEYTKTLFGGDMAPLLRRNGGHVFEDSLELVHAPVAVIGDTTTPSNNLFWTPQFLKEFAKRRGYDLTKDLPAAFPAYDFPDGGGARVKHDYYEMLSDLLVDNHYKPITEWAHDMGLGSRAQGYNLVGTDKARVSAGLDLPDGESLDSGDTGAAIAPGSETAHGVIDDYRQVASGAHLSGAREMTLEAGANISNTYGMTDGDYKAIADRAYAAGITTMALHGFAYKDFQDAYQPWSWPGWASFNTLFAESWNETFPQMATWPVLAGYLGRVSAALRNGAPRVDLTVLDKPRTPHAYGSEDLVAALHDSTYTWDRVDDESFAGLPVPKGDRLLPDGPAYRAVIVDGMSSLSAGSAERLLAIARAGVPVVVKGDVPAHGASFRAPAAEDARVKAAVDAVLGLANVRRAKTGKAALDALAELAIQPDLRSALPLVAQHRRTAAGDVWFIYNDSPKRATGSAIFATRGVPVVIDPYSGEAAQVARFDAGKDGVALPVDLGPGDTMLLTFDRDARGGGRRDAAAPSDLPAPMTVAGPWALKVHTVGPDGDGDVALQLSKLADWRDIPELQSSSGTGIYTTRVTMPDSWLAAGRGVLLDPGDVGGMYTVEVNGRRAVFPVPADGPRDITGLLRPGDNELRVTVATTLNNVIVGRAQSGDARYAEWTTRSTQPYGLMGPVRLVPFAQATAATVPLPCASRRAFPINVRAPRGFRPRSATLRIGKTSRRARVRKVGRRLRITINLRGLPKGRVRVLLTVRGAGGRSVRTARSYRLCAPRR